MKKLRAEDRVRRDLEYYTEESIDNKVVDMVR